MAHRSQALLGLLLGLVGCQSYPYSHNPGMYPSMPAGAFVPPTTSAVAPPGRAAIRSGQPGQSLGQPMLQAPAGGVPAGPGNRQVPRPIEPDAGPPNLGAPDLGEEDFVPKDRKGTSYRDNDLAPLDESAAEGGAMLADFGQESFAAPRPVRTIGDSVDGDEMPRQVRKAVRSPYLRDSSGQYAWLRGTVSRDPHGAGWRLRYSDDPLDRDDRYGGEIVLTGNKRLDLLVDGDVVLVYGQVADADGAPVYRVQSVDKLKPKP